MMHKDQIRVFVKEPESQWVEATIDNTLEALQKLVGGYIETVPADNRTCLIVNEEGQWLNLPFNTIFGQHDLYGTIVAVGTDGEDFADVPCGLDAWLRIFRGLAGKRCDIRNVSAEIAIPKSRYWSVGDMERSRRELLAKLAKQIELVGGIEWCEIPERRGGDARSLNAKLSFTTADGVGLSRSVTMTHCYRSAVIPEGTALAVVEQIKKHTAEAIVEDMRTHRGILWTEIRNGGNNVRLRASVRVVACRKCD